MNYWLHCNAILEEVVELERTGPWTAYNDQRAKRHAQKTWKIMVIDGPFNLLVIALVTLYLYNAYKLAVVPYSVIFLLFIAGGYIFLTKADKEAEAKKAISANGVSSKVNEDASHAAKPVRP